MKNRRLKSIVLWFTFLLLAISATVFSLEYFSNYKSSETTHIDAPVITRKSIVINAPVEKVWKVFSDVNNWDAWQK
ncbi:SRPBCC family protein [Epilithonimonas hungarica]|uniref:hypothetical protein n=1 Tax=Epilithonimonas hungarica TaxID=454006 RepID=UPI000B7EC399|nr:hypothetical protein [Epilithonimonas hungarica]